MFKRFGRRPEKSKQKTEQLWERGASNDPGVQDNASQQVTSDSVRSLLKTAIVDVEKIAASIKMRAQTEAEAEAARIIAQARLEAEEVKGKAVIDAQRQAEDVLSEANRKAEVTEVEAKQSALQFLLKASEEIDKEVQGEYKRIYSQLSSSLQNLVSEGQDIQRELKDKTARLLESKNLELKKYETRLLSDAEAIVPSAEISAPVETELKPDVTGEEKVEEPRMEIEDSKKTRGDRKQAGKTAKLAAKEEAKSKAEEAKRAREALKQAEKAAKLAAKEEAKSKAEEAKRAKEAQKKVKKEARLIAKEGALEGKVEEPVQREEGALEEKVEEPVQREEGALEGKVEEPAQPAEEVKKQAKEAKRARGAQKKGKKEARLVTKEETLEEKVEEPVQREEEPKMEIEDSKKTRGDRKQAEMAAKEEAKSKAEEAKRARDTLKQAEKAAKLAAKEEALEEKVEEPAQPEKKDDRAEREAAPLRLDRQALYTGEVELVIASPVELKLVTKLYNYLQTIPELKILYTQGSWDRGTAIAVVLEKPMPLVNILLQTPGVEVIPARLEKDGTTIGKSSALLGGGEKKVGGIRLILREASSS